MFHVYIWAKELYAVTRFGLISTDQEHITWLWSV